MPDEPPRDARPPADLRLLEQAGLLDGLDRPGAVVLDIGGGSGELTAELMPRHPRLTCVPERDPERLPERVDLALSVGALEGLTPEEAERWAQRLYERGAAALFSLDREHAGVRSSLERYYWLRGLWVDDGRPGRKPDPTSGPVPREEGRYRHLVGRRRLRVVHAVGRTP